jgi:DnaJ-class molecular chaperone
MKAAEIKVGGIYWANVSGKKAKVCVDGIHQQPGIKTGSQKFKARTTYMVTNLSTGRTIVFRSARRFLDSVADAEAVCRKVGAAIEQATVGSIPTRPRGNPDCPTCDGYGMIVTHSQLPDGRYTDSSESPCPECMVAGGEIP